ncbi:hypothetical protein C8R47DRAFT_779638 [Mycena vitilis]|nr:hypothetical protein C8R47DRAFT_779638 [Mycena vitilis]
MAEKLRKETRSEAKVGKPKREKGKPEEEGDEETTAVHKAKREKRKRDMIVVERGEESAQEHEPRQKKPKKNKTGFPDPGDDPALSEQASRALSYAFLQFRKPSKWKFSKARQNWLIRNVWSETIPDAYLALTVQYFSNVKGGVRETLIKDCKSVLLAASEKSVLSAPAEKVSLAETTSEVQPQPANTADVAQSSQLKLTRARALLDALETPNSPLPE